MLDHTLVNINGKITSPDQARVSVFDRGFLYGDSLYEVARSYSGKFIDLHEHLNRLEKSAALCQMDLAQSKDELKKEILKTYEAFQKLPGQKNSDVYCRLIVTRGVGKIGFDLSCLLTPSQFIIIQQPLAPFTEDQWNRGLNLRVSSRVRNDPRALDPAAKTGNYLNNLLAYLEVTQSSDERCDDAILCNSEGHVTEGTTFNLFYVKNSILVTPPLDIGVLDGVTRRKVIEFAQASTESVKSIREVRFPKERLYEADEVFATSTLKAVFPVTQIDGKKIKNGKPGGVTQKLNQAFQTWVHHQLRLSE